MQYNAVYNSIQYFRLKWIDFTLLKTKRGRLSNNSKENFWLRNASISKNSKARDVIVNIKEMYE